MIYGNTKVYSVIGNPVKHSKSPNMHNAAFKELNINACYVPLQPKDNELEHVCSLIRSGVLSGSNVTIPFKESVINFVDILTDEASMIGSVNTLYPKDGKLVGDNTDGLGFKKSLFIDLGFKPENKSAIILGAGGAAKAVTAKLCQADLKSLAIFDIDTIKAQNLLAHIGKFNYKTNVKLISPTEVDSFSSQCDLIINCTPIGMKDNDPLIVSKEVFSSRHCVYDLVYTPPVTKLLSSAQQAGAKILNGMDMLAYQGAESFSIWENVEPPYEIMKQELANA
ncbi:shikimate dehydrogenase [Desulfobacterota bacterium]|nr:shikimate dehydrogenase [Thermodesulfobacteriota bacterium]|tara:strand:+ start:23472 stop:24314 length:843 start_codon:yes stop_codon:yes gene_type:complete